MTFLVVSLILLVFVLVFCKAWVKGVDKARREGGWDDNT
jgi:hypothetical protein